MNNTNQNKKPKQFKQTFIRYNLYVRMRDADQKWEVVKKIPSPCFVYDETWKGGRTPKGVIIKPMVWVTQSVHDTRAEALEKAKELNEVKKSS